MEFSLGRTGPVTTISYRLDGTATIVKLDRYGIVCYNFFCNVFRKISSAGCRMFLPAKLKQLRIARGKSLQQLADDIGSSKAHVWDLETGRSTNPSIELLTKLAWALKVSVADLVGENPTGQEEDAQSVAMFRELKELTPEERDAIQGIIDRFKSRTKPK